MSAKDDEQDKVDGEAAAAGVSGDAVDASKSEVKDDVSDAEEFKSPEVKVDSVDTEESGVDAVDGVGEGDGEHGEKRKSKARAEELSLQLEGVPALSRQSLEVDTRSRSSTVSRPFTPSAHHAPDSPTTSLISSLREQLQILSLQSEQLNNKLVASISKHADLEDQVFALTNEREQQKLTVEELERAKAQWEESMNTGLLVERSAIREEMQRLAAGLVEEERRRGSAEERREQVESEVDNLTATLFEQANTMVATERMSRAQAEGRLKETEENLAAAEAAMRDMQQHLQSLPAAEARGPAAPQIPRRYISSHPPYSEFNVLLSHLRALRPSPRARQRNAELYPVPALSSLLAQPFLARCVAEDHDPTLRLEQAADLGWVSRRSVSSAIISGDLLIEPMSAATLGPLETITCALCGRGIFSQNNPRGILKLFSSPGAPVTANSTNIYVFRVATGAEKDAKAYPLCRNGWCLERLRAACALWHFIRTGIVHPVWNGDDGSEGSRAAKQVDLDVPPEADRLTTSPALRQPVARSASAPNAAAAHAPSAASRVTVDALAGAESRYEPRRKSGWGLGGLSKGSWSWSRPTTPGAKEGEREIKEEVKGETRKDVVLGAPIELEEGKLEGEKVENGKAEGEKVDMSAEETAKDETKEEDEAVKEQELEEKEAEKDAEGVTELGRSASRASRDTATSGDSFATPSGENRSLAGDAEEKDASEVDLESADKEKDVSEESTVKTHSEEAEEKPSSDVAEGKVEAKEEETSEEKDDVEETKAAKSDESEDVEAKSDTAVGSEESSAKESDEAAAKVGSKADVDGEVAESTPAADSTTAAASSPALPPRASGRAAPPPPLPKRSAARGPTPPITPTDAHDPSQAETPTTATPLAKPPPPPRRSFDIRSSSDSQRRPPNTPGSTLAPPNEDYDGRSFIAGDGWEIRAWKQVIKLKEDMWRARVGVLDD